MKCPYCNNEQYSGDYCEKCGANIRASGAQYGNQGYYGQPPNQNQGPVNPYQQGQADPYRQDPGNPYGQQNVPPPYPYQPQDNNRAQSGGGQGLAIAGMILGIISLVFCDYGWIFGIAAIIFSAIAKSKLSKINAPTGMATAGLVMGIIGTCWIIFFFLSLAGLFTILGS